MFVALTCQVTHLGFFFGLRQVRGVGGQGGVGVGGVQWGCGGVSAMGLPFHWEGDWVIRSLVLVGLREVSMLLILSMGLMSSPWALLVLGILHLGRACDF